MDSTTERDERRQAWSRFWATGALHSCAGSFSSDYDGAIGRHWTQRLSALPPGSRVLDVGTGNGALPKLLLRCSADATCDAVDIAQNAPDWLQAESPEDRSRLRFHSGVAAEGLPFPDASFDLVASQYALEYTDLARSIGEVVRVLVPGGRLEAVAHHRDSLPLQLAGVEQAHIAYLRAPDGFMDAIGGMIEPMSRLGRPQGAAELDRDPQAQAARQRFDAEASRLDGRARDDRCPDLLLVARDWAAQIFRTAAQHGAGRGRAAWDEASGLLQDAHLRLADLQDAALDEGGIASLAARLEGRGCTPQVGLLMEEDVLLGWQLSALRAGSG